MTQADINFSIATAMAINPARQGDVVLIADGKGAFDLFGESRLCAWQRLVFREWARRSGYGDASPEEVAAQIAAAQ